MKMRILAVVAAAAAFTPTFPAFSQVTFNPNQYGQTNLVSSIGSDADVTDINLRNPWGLSRSSNGDWWISDNLTGLSTLYSGTTGAITPLIVTIPPADPETTPHGSPTGTIFNGTTGFTIAPGKPAIFLFSTVDGTISGWNPGVQATKAVITVKEKGASYTGLTSAVAVERGTSSTYLYAANFGKNRVDVFDVNFRHVAEVERRINRIPVPEGYSPFNVQNLGGNIYVTLAKKGSNGFDVHAPGLGIVAAIAPEGRLIQVFEAGKFLNAPWGLAVAPSDFGAYSHDILVGNFGDGSISAFDPITGRFKGQLQDKNKAKLVIPGLWALSVGNGTVAGGPATSVFFSAGPNEGQDGLFGSLSALSNPSGNDQ